MACQQFTRTEAPAGKTGYSALTECESQCKVCGVPYGPFSWNDFPSNLWYVTGNVPGTEQTITVPANLTLPVKATFNNGCDDGIVIDGVRKSGFNQPNVSFIINNRTFVTSIVNDGGPWWCGGEFCFQSCSAPDANCCSTWCCPSGPVGLADVFSDQPPYASEISSRAINIPLRDPESKYQFYWKIGRAHV